MKLDRNINGTGRGKYGLVKNRELKAFLLKASESDATIEAATDIIKAIVTLERAGIIDWGDTPETEFFVMKLKDRYARGGLYGYSNAAYIEDREYAMEVEALADHAGPLHPLCKKPD